MAKKKSKKKETKESNKKETKESNKKETKESKNAQKSSYASTIATVIVVLGLIAFVVFMVVRQPSTAVDTKTTTTIEQTTAVSGNQTAVSGNPIKMTIITDARCPSCDTTQFIDSLKQIFPGLQVKTLDYRRQWRWCD